MAHIMSVKRKLLNIKKFNLSSVIPSTGFIRIKILALVVLSVYLVLEARQVNTAVKFLEVLGKEGAS